MQIRRAFLHRVEERRGGYEVIMKKWLAVVVLLCLCVTSLAESFQKGDSGDGVRQLQERLGVAYLFIAHDLLVVHHISNRIAVMYLGKMVELADAAEIYDHPLHPYSKALISAVPVPDPVVARANRRIQMTGEIPSPLNAPPGCPFHTRCPYAKDSCKESMPELREIETGRFVACHRVEEIN